MPLIFSNPSIFLFCAQGADLREPVDERVVQKIREMQVIGVRRVAEGRRHLEKFVKDELFNGEELPAETSRRYYPADVDIRNILYASRSGERRSSDDQVNLQKKCVEWQESHPDDFIFYRVS